MDRTYRKRVRQARAAGLPVGACHFARPDPGDAVEEARFFLRNSDIRAGDMLPMLDLESLEGMTLAAVTRWTGGWIATVTRELARRGLVGRPIISTPPLDLGNGFGCLLWVGRYSDDFRAPRIPRPWTRAAIWQHADGRFGPVERLPGFGPIDVSAVHPDVPLSALRVRSAASPSPALPPAPSAPPAPPTPTSSSAPPPAPPCEPPAEPPAGASPAAPEPAPQFPAGADAIDLAADLAAVRTSLEEAVRSLRTALDRLPER